LHNEEAKLLLPDAFSSTKMRFWQGLIPGPLALREGKGRGAYTSTRMGEKGREGPCPSSKNMLRFGMW